MENEHFKVVTVGIMVADIMVNPVNCIPEPGKLSLVDSIELFSGGNAMTAAINLSKLGIKSAVCGKIGCDFWGDFLIGCLEKNKVSAAAVVRDKSVQTSASAALIADNGERAFIHCKGANARLSENDIDMNIIKNADCVFVTGTFLLDSFDGDETADFLKKCKSLSKTTFLDVCWDACGNWGEKLFSAMPYIDWFMPSIDEAREISGKSNLKEMTDVFFDKGVRHTVIKCGADGCFLRLSREDDGRIIPSFRCESCADTTGAGDSFCSGFIAAYTKGAAPEECAKFANAVGAMCVTSRGATSGTGSYEETIKFIKEHESHE